MCATLCRYLLRRTDETILRRHHPRTLERRRHTERGSRARGSPRDQKKKPEEDAKCRDRRAGLRVLRGLLGTKPHVAHDIGRPTTLNNRVCHALRKTRRRARWRERSLCAEKLSFLRSHRSDYPQCVERTRLASFQRRREKAATHERVPRDAPYSRESRACRAFRTIQFRSVARWRIWRNSASASVSETPSARRMSKSVRSSRRPARRISLRTSAAASPSARPIASYE